LDDVTPAGRELRGVVSHESRDGNDGTRAGGQCLLPRTHEETGFNRGKEPDSHENGADCHGNRTVSHRDRGNCERNRKVSLGNRADSPETLPIDDRKQPVSRGNRTMRGGTERCVP
jgi:hypothetical protein